MILLDTTIAVDHLGGQAAATELIERLLGSGEDLGASEIVRFELLAGIRPVEIHPVEVFCSALTWLAIDEPVTRLAGQLARRYRRSHAGIDAADYLIAATSLVHAAPLLTTNVRHFPMLPGLRPPY